MFISTMPSSAAPRKHIQRPQSLIRRNWLKMGSHETAPRTAARIVDDSRCLGEPRAGLGARQRGVVSSSPLRARAATKSEHAHLRQPRAEALVRERLLQRVELDVGGGHEQQRQEQAE